LFGVEGSASPEKEEEKKPVVDLAKDNWDSGSDLSLEVEEEKPREEKEEAGEKVDSDIFVPPSEGVDPLKELLRANPSNVALNVVGGDFRKGLELLKN
jgi:hypothetical protein